jgi:hypothetical protein
VSGAAARFLTPASPRSEADLTERNAGCPLFPQQPTFFNPAGYVSFAPILLQKSFWGDERKFLEPLMRFTHGDVRDHIVSSKRSRISVVALKSDAAAEKPKDQLSRDFLGCSIFDFCNNIRHKRSFDKSARERQPGSL